MEEKAAEEKTEIDLTRWLEMSTGDVSTLCNVPCRLININTGKRRITFESTIDVPMPKDKTTGHTGRYYDSSKEGTLDYTK